MQIFAFLFTPSGNVINSIPLISLVSCSKYAGQQLLREWGIGKLFFWRYGGFNHGSQSKIQQKNAFWGIFDPLKIYFYKH